MKTISHEKYDEFCEAHIYLNSIKQLLGAKTAAEALERVKELAKEVAA